LRNFELHPDSLSLNAGDKVILRHSYEAASPVLFGCLLSPKPPPHALEMDSYHFVRDKAAIFAGLIEILYSMRNMLFHGELVPDSQTNRTFEPAYHLVRHLTIYIA
jgi:hypothetical protein